jgi:hypothetical protein
MPVVRRLKVRFAVNNNYIIIMVYLILSYLNLNPRPYYSGTPSLLRYSQSGRLNVPADSDRLHKESNFNSHEDHTAPL